MSAQILESVRAVVTGGTSGIGSAMAHALAEAGARVVVTSRSAERTRSAAAAIPRAIGIAADSRDEDSIRKLADTAWSSLGGIDVLVNNAGLGMISISREFMTRPVPFWTVTPASFRAVVETNLVGYFLAAREFVPRMLEQGGGRIVNVTVNQATMVRAGFVPYGPSRAATEAMSHAMAAELVNSPVRVNLLLPGGITSTGMVHDAALPDNMRTLSPSVMAEPIVWLASAAAKDVHDERISALGFADWRAERELGSASSES